MFKRRYLWIDMDTSKSSVEEMEEVFQKVFGTKQYTSFALRVFRRRLCHLYCYNTMGLQNIVWGETCYSPIETLEENVEVIPLSSILLGETSIGTL